jgi:ABC-type multidrug transport system fused ATPase/permease subunit
VVVGANGSGKSTILKLITRLYDPTTGEILINGRDIRTLKLADLRSAVSVLFQDYTHFPLSVCHYSGALKKFYERVNQISENIGLGDPVNEDNEDQIRAAAKLSGAEEFVDQLADGFRTYLEHPVQSYYSPHLNHLRDMGHLTDSTPISLSGGQMQKLAL